MRRAASIPSRRGILTSSTATSGSSLRASSTASSPSRASAQTSNPARSSRARRSSLMIVSSSAMRTLTNRSLRRDLRGEALREHVRVAVGVVEHAELDHALDLVRVAVEADVVRLEVLPRDVDVLHAERWRGRARLHLFGLPEADRHVLRGGRHLAPAVLLELVDELEAEHFAVPLDCLLHVGHADGDREVLAVLEGRVRGHRCHLCLLAHCFLLSFPCSILSCFYTTNTSMSILIALFHNRWSVPILAELHRQRGSRFVTLARTLGMSRESLRRTLAALIDSGLVGRNPGYGHPLRPEYVLTSRGSRLAARSRPVVKLLRERGLEEVGLKKWSMPVLYALSAEPLRFSELRDRLEGISPRSLALALKELEAAGVVERRVTDDYPPATSYRLAPGARRLASLVGELAR